MFPMGVRPGRKYSPPKKPPAMAAKVPNPAPSKLDIAIRVKRDEGEASLD
jgi:hypothetical protein